MDILAFIYVIVKINSTPSKRQVIAITIKTSNPLNEIINHSGGFVII